MRRMIPLAAALALLGGALSGCDEGGKAKSSYQVSDPHQAPMPEPEAAQASSKKGKDLVAYAAATDFTGAASSEDASGKASAMFDGSAMRDAVGANPPVAGASGAGKQGKRVKYTAASSERLSDLNGAVPPLPDGYDYSKTGAASPGSIREAGETLLGFAAFQVEQKFPSVAPIMSRLGWNAAPRVGSNVPQKPYRVTVHHTQGRHPLTEDETAKAVKGTQHYHMVGRGLEGKDNFHDIGYHFLIAGDGRVAEGRRAEYLGAHAGGANAGNIGVAMMGDFNKIKPTAAQVESLTRLVTFLSVKYKKDPLAKGFLEPHMHYNNTDCPGKNMMAILESLRRKIDHEHDVILAGGSLGEAFTPLAVYGVKSA